MGETTSNSRVSPQEIEALIANAAQEPGLNDIIELQKWFDAVAQVERLQAEMLTQPCSAQVAGTAGWVY